MKAPGVYTCGVKTTQVVLTAGFKCFSDWVPGTFVLFGVFGKEVMTITLQYSIGSLALWGDFNTGLQCSKRVNSPGGSDGKESACSAGVPSLIPGLGRSFGERNGYPLQYSCLENPMDRGAWWSTVHGAVESRVRLTLSLSFHSCGDGMRSQRGCAPDVT